MYASISLIPRACLNVFDVLFLLKRDFYLRGYLGTTILKRDILKRDRHLFSILKRYLRGTDTYLY